MPLDAPLSHLAHAAEHLAEAIRAVESAERDADDCLTAAQKLGIRRETEQLEELRTKIRTVAGHTTTASAIASECVSLLNDIKFGADPQLGTSPGPERSATGERTHRRWLQTYASPLIAGLWSIVLLSSIPWHWPSLLWLPANQLLVGAFLATVVLGGTHPFDTKIHRLLLILLAAGACTPVIEYLLRGSIRAGTLIGFAILVVELAVAMVLYRQRRPTRTQPGQPGPGRTQRTAQK